MKIVKTLIVFIILFFAVYFFLIQFQEINDKLKSGHFIIHYQWLIVSFFLYILIFISNNYLWKYSIEKITNIKLTNKESFTIYTSSQFGKYLPGKIWAITAQYFLLKEKGVSKFGLGYFILILITSTLITQTLAGVFLWALSSNLSNLKLLGLFSCVVVFLIIYKYSIIHHTFLIKKMVNIFNKFLKSPIEITQISNLILYRINIYCFIISICFILFSSCLLLSFNNNIKFSGILLVTSGFLLGDIVGFLSFFIPGGIGIREMFIYGFMHKYSDEIAVLFPILSRIIQMIVELILGIIGTILFFKIRKSLISSNE